MIYTSAQANKILRTLQEEYDELSAREKQAKRFVAAVTENPEDVKPDYCFLETQDRLMALEKKMRAIKHKINEYNVSHRIEALDMTIDEALVYIPQLTNLKKKLAGMVKALPKKRVEQSYGSRSNLIEYEYANYNLSVAKDYYSQISKKLFDAQLALDEANQIPAIELDD